MRKLAKKLSAIALCTVFASMQIVSAAGLSNASINSTKGGFVNMTEGTNSATLNFNNNAHVDWNKLNVGANETLNFNAIGGAKGLTVLNTVSGGQMTKISGTVNSNAGIAKLIISNPSGMLYDGAKFTTAGDLMITTQAMNSVMNGNQMVGVTGVNQAATQGITIQNSDFSVGGEFNITAPTINAIQTAVRADKGFKLVTRDGQNYLVSTVNGETDKGVRLESVSVDGDVYIVSGKDYTKVVNGGNITGDLNVDSQGIVALNYVNNGNQLEVNGDVNVESNGALNPTRGAQNYEGAGNFMYMRNAKVDGNVKMKNSGGFLEVKDVNVGKNMELTTTTGANSHIKHFVHLEGYNTIGGNVDIDSVHNIHIGNYDYDAKQILDGSLNVGGDLNAHAKTGHVMVTVNTKADKINLKSDDLNVLTDAKSILTANEYKFSSNGYIGAINSYTNAAGEHIDGTERIISLMENYQYIPKDILAHDYIQIAGGNVTEVKTPEDASVYIKSLGDMNVNGVDTGKLNITAINPNDPLGGNITLGDNVKADTVRVGGETKLLTLPLPSRNYKLEYTNIKDTEVVTINPDTEITYDMLEKNPTGYNCGVQTANNTRIKAPNRPADPTDPVNPTPADERKLRSQDNDNVKILNNLNRDQVAQAIDAGQVYTPIAFAADLDDELENAVRKNVDGSVTVVKPYIPTKK